MARWSGSSSSRQKARSCEQGGRHGRLASVLLERDQPGREMARESLQNATSWTAAQGARAQGLRAGGSDREKIRIEHTPREREASRKLQLPALSASGGFGEGKTPEPRSPAQEQGRPGDSGRRWKTEEGRPCKAAGYKGAGGDNAF